jgi:hypothetical protein
MNMRTITIGAGLLIGSGLLAQSKQISLGADLMLPQGDFSKEFSLGVGPTVGFELPLGDKLGLTIQAGYNILMLKDEIKEVLDGASIIPAQAGLKYYFMESQKGLYAHGQVGIHAFSEKFKENDLFGLEAETESKTNFSWGIGAGYQLAKLDIGVRYNMVMAGEEEGESGGEEEGESLSYIGLRIAYILSLGE